MRTCVWFVHTASVPIYIVVQKMLLFGTNPCMFYAYQLL